MPVTRSAERALRKDRKRTKVNKIVRSKFITAVKKTRQSPTKDNLRSCFSCLDRAVKKKIIHKNKAARLKSRLAKLVVSTKEKVAKSKK